MRSYHGAQGLTLYHFDFYRLGGDEDLDTIGLEDCLREDAVVLAEWPSICPGAFPEYTLRLELDAVDADTRRIRAFAGALPLPAPMRTLTDF
jgi:tRNA threonylcarbamoyladenosine biosynthesis protein TsaE